MMFGEIEPALMPLRTQLVHHVLDDFGSGVQQEHGDFRIFHPVQVEHRIIAAGQLGVFLADLGHTLPPARYMAIDC